MAFSDFNSYFWEGQNTLANKLNIHNEIELEFAANEYAAVRMAELLTQPVPKSFDADYIKSVHRTLFGDVYEWAGEYRTCPMARNQDYCAPENISMAIDSFCASFRTDFLTRGFDSKRDIADVLAKAWADLNSVHPFRDGNGRSQFVFFNKACLSKGYELASSKRDLGNLRAARDSASMGRLGLLEGMLFRSLSEIDSRKIEASRLKAGLCKEVTGMDLLSASGPGDVERDA